MIKFFFSFLDAERNLYSGKSKETAVKNNRFFFVNENIDYISVFDGKWCSH